MKQPILILLNLLGTYVLTAQQTPLYIMFNSACMDQLEYRYVYAGSTVNAFSLRPTANEQYILTAGSSGISSPTLPKTTVNCREYAFNDQFLNEVNNVSRQVYIVQQLSKGYILTPVISATQVIRSGTYYLYRAPNYSFAIDTSNLVYESNIATGSSSWYIYFNGLKIRACYYEYSFKREPTKLNQERSEFDFIPGIGLTSERTGMTAAEAENNHYRLLKINGMALEDYISGKCQTQSAPGTAPLSQYTPKVNYGTTPIREEDKEKASAAINANSPMGPPLPPALANCPEYPGEGYHIVQPKETLNGIARAYNIPVKSLITWNKIKDPDKINVCQKIWLQKPPANVNAIAYKGNDGPATYSTGDQTVIRQDVYWQKNAAAPAVTYNYNYAQPQPATAAAQPYTPPAQTLVHTVQKGETLYGIGQRYGLTESEMRRLNSFPAAGEVILKPGMQLFISDCCPANLNAQPATTTQPANYPALGTQPAYQPWTPPAAAQPQLDPGSGVLPELYSTPTTTQPVSTTAQPAATAPGTNQPAKQPAYFQEYIVREGDTINSVAIKFKVSAQELALVNNKEPNETLIAGQRLLIPRN